MTRVLIRVPLHFDWPRGKKFEGDAPPLGTGYQVWDDDIPAPVSPIYKTEDGIILWCMEQGYSRMNAVEFVRNSAKLPEN